MICFSVKYLPTNLFSLKDSNSTNSGAKALFLPSPYSIKMAILNQAITIGGDLDKLKMPRSKEFEYIRDAKMSFHVSKGSSFCVNNSFVKILRQKDIKEGGGYKPTVAFREYIFLSHPLEIVFEVESEESKSYLKQYLHKINYFGKRGCFFQFLEYSDMPNEANVKPFQMNSSLFGVLQEYDDFDKKATFENANNFSSVSAKRKKQVWALPLKKVSSSKSFTNYIFE